MTTTEVTETEATMARFLETIAQDFVVDGWLEPVEEAERVALSQGDVTLIPIDKPLPGCVVREPAEDGFHYLAGEPGVSGHVLPGDGSVRVLQGVGDTRVVWLDVLRPTDLTHQRPDHRHATIRIAPGFWEVRRQIAHRVATSSVLSLPRD